MSALLSAPRCAKFLLTLAAACSAFALAPAAQARVMRIVFDGPPVALAGQPIAYEQIAGRAFGELDPADPRDRKSVV